jgi:poly(3-hydroxyalkanoate) synthetase
MVLTIIVKKSTRKNKKYMAIVDGRKVHFGQAGASDYTIHKDNARKQRYINRHIKREKQFWTHKRANLLRASYWARWLLWNKKTALESKKFIEQRQNIDIS